MARSGIQFQKGLSLPEFQRLYGTEEQCEAALEQARWPDGDRKRFGIAAKSPLFFCVKNS